MPNIANKLVDFLIDSSSILPGSVYGYGGAGKSSLSMRDTSPLVGLRAPG